MIKIKKLYYADTLKFCYELHCGWRRYKLTGFLFSSRSRILNGKTIAYRAIIRRNKENMGKRVIVNGYGHGFFEERGTIVGFLRTDYAKGIPYVEVKLDKLDGLMRNVYFFPGHKITLDAEGRE